MRINSTASTAGKRWQMWTTGSRDLSVLARKATATCAATASSRQCIVRVILFPQMVQIIDVTCRPFSHQIK